MGEKKPELIPLICSEEGCRSKKFSSVGFMAGNLWVRCDGCGALVCLKYNLKNNEWGDFPSKETKRILDYLEEFQRKEDNKNVSN